MREKSITGSDMNPTANIIGEAMNANVKTRVEGQHYSEHLKEMHRRANLQKNLL